MAKAPQPRARVTAVVPSEPEIAVEEALAPLVTVVVPKDYVLTLDTGGTVAYRTGTQEMPRDHLEHWWSRVQGVTEYVKEA